MGGALKVPQLTPRTLRRLWAQMDASENQKAHSGERATEVITKSISQYLVSDKSWKSKLLTVGRQLKLDCGEWHNNHRRRTLKEHVVIGTWPKKITRWKELACEQHGQSFAHASRQTGEDVVPILMVSSGGDDVGLQLSYFQCHSDGKQVFKTAHLKIVQIGREGWVAVLQKTVECRRPWRQLSFAEEEDPHLLLCA